MADIQTPDAPLAPAVVDTPKPILAPKSGVQTPRTCVVKKHVCGDDPDTGETFVHTLSEALEVRDPATDKKVTKPAVFARDYGQHREGVAVVAEYTDFYSESVCPTCGYDIAEARGTQLR